MSKLLAVEYAPEPRRRGRPSPNSILAPRGFQGETDLDHFYYLLNLYETAVASNGAGSTEAPRVHVRFPLLLPNYCIEFFPNQRDPSSRVSLETEGISVPITELIPIKSTPISNYSGEKFQLSSIEALGELLGREEYLYTKNKNVVIEALSKSDRWTYLWRISKEITGTGPNQKKFLFREARFYGAHSVVPLYNKKFFSGFALELIFQPIPSESEYKSKVRHMGWKRNVYLLTNTSEYVNHLDGEEFGTLKTLSKDAVVELVNRSITPKAAKELFSKWKK